MNCQILLGQEPALELMLQCFCTLIIPYLCEYPLIVEQPCDGSVQRRGGLWYRRNWQNMVTSFPKKNLSHEVEILGGTVFSRFHPTPGMCLDLATLGTVVTLVQHKELWILSFSPRLAYASGAKLEALKKTGNKTWRAGPPLQVGQYAVQSRTLKLRQVHIKASGYRLNVFDIIKPVREDRFEINGSPQIKMSLCTPPAVHVPQVDQLTLAKMMSHRQAESQDHVMAHKKCDSAELHDPKIMKIHKELIKRRGSIRDIPEEAVSVGEFLLQLLAGDAKQRCRLAIKRAIVVFQRETKSNADSKTSTMRIVAFGELLAEKVSQKDVPPVFSSGIYMMS
ncbi:hypothetical protein TURU_114609 [Turdus rufiventris]|nr:hypothetical protein TURU_114609 [Turdus rufiventris]